MRVRWEWGARGSHARARIEPGGGDAEETEIEMPEVRVEGESAGPRVFASLTEGDDGEGETSGGGTAARTS